MVRKEILTIHHRNRSNFLIGRDQLFHHLVDFGFPRFMIFESQHTGIARGGIHCCFHFSQMTIDNLDCILNSHIGPVMHGFLYDMAHMIILPKSHGEHDDQNHHDDNHGSSGGNRVVYVLEEFHPLY